MIKGAATLCALVLELGKEKAVALPAQTCGCLRCNYVVIFYKSLQVNLDRRLHSGLRAAKNRPPVPQVLRTGESYSRFISKNEGCQHQVCNACGFVYLKYVMHHNCTWVAWYMIEVLKEELNVSVKSTRRWYTHAQLWCAVGIIRGNLGVEMPLRVLGAIATPLHAPRI